jgi:hypothetical protein
VGPSGRSKNGVRKKLKKHTDVVWKAHFTAIHDHPELYTIQEDDENSHKNRYGSGSMIGKPKFDALLGNVDGTRGIPELVKHFGAGNSRNYAQEYNRYWGGKNGRKIKESTNCTKCMESATGKCDDVGKSIDSLALFKVYCDHTGGDGERATRSRFEGIEYVQE